VLTCAQAVTCGLGCLNFTMIPPQINASCLAGCVSNACPNAQVFINEFFSCALTAAFQCSDPQCVLGQCSSELSLCLGSHC
jgi:hypothetical protein